MGHGIEEAPDIRVKHPVHLLPENAGVEGVERIVLAAPRSESVGEPEEVFLVDCFGVDARSAMESRLAIDRRLFKNEKWLESHTVPGPINTLVSQSPGHQRTA